MYFLLFVTFWQKYSSLTLHVGAVLCQRIVHCLLSVPGNAESDTMWRSCSRSSLLQRQDCVDLKPLATETEYVLGRLSLTEQELAQALTRMTLEDESQSTDIVDVTLVLGTMSVEEKGAADLKRKQRSGCKASLKLLRGLEGREPASMTAREKKLRKKHEYNMRRFVRLTNLTKYKKAGWGSGWAGNPNISWHRFVQEDHTFFTEDSGNAGAQLSDGWRSNGTDKSSRTNHTLPKGGNGWKEKEKEPLLC